MVSEAFEAVLSLRTLALVLVVFGVAPGMVLRFLTLAFHPQDPRRAEIRASSTPCRRSSARSGSHSNSRWC